MANRASSKSPGSHPLTDRPCLDSLTPLGLSTNLLEQLEGNRELMYRLANDFPPDERALIQTSVAVAMVCHHAHTRIGTPPIHYSHHLFEVMRRVKELSLTGTLQATPLDETLAIKLAVAALHDSMEDIARTFPTLTHRVQGFSVVEDYIRLKLTPVCRPATVDVVCNAVRTLSITNDVDFNDSLYVAGIAQSDICRPIKWADVDHNMITMPEAGATSGAVIYPAQYNTLMSTSPYYTAFIHQVLVCAKRCETTISPETIGTTKLGRALIKLHTFEGPAGLLRLETLYEELGDRLQKEPTAPIFPTRYKAAKIAKVIESQLSSIRVVLDALPEGQSFARALKTASSVKEKPGA